MKKSFSIVSQKVAATALLVQIVNSQGDPHMYIKDPPTTTTAPGFFTAQTFAVLLVVMAFLYLGAMLCQICNEEPETDDDYVDKADLEYASSYYYDEYTNTYYEKSDDANSLVGKDYRQNISLNQSESDRLSHHRFSERSDRRRKSQFRPKQFDTGSEQGNETDDQETGLGQELFFALGAENEEASSDVGGNNRKHTKKTASLPMLFDSRSEK